MDTPTRRDVLGCIAGASALAGCASRSTTSTQFSQVTTVGTSLVVELDSADGVDELSVIDPDGAGFRTVDVTAGQTRYTIEIGTGYTPGEYEINTVADGDVAATTTIEIRPNVEITDVGVGANHPEEMPDNLPFSETQLIVSAQNTGTGPEAITNLEVTGGIPNPVTREDIDESGIFDVENGYGEVEKLTIGAEADVRFFSSTYPFGRKVNSCQDGTFRVNLLTSVSQDDVSERYSVKYKDSSQDECRVSIQEVNNV